jgi:hypothetical protein
MLTIGAVCSAVLALAAGAPAALSSAPAANGQFVGGVVEQQFGVAVGSDGRVQGNSSTIGVTVTRSVLHGVPVITIAPTD